MNLRQHAVWRRLAEPSLVRRSTWSVLGVFVLLWVVLLGYLYWENRMYLAEAPGMQRYGNSLLAALDAQPDEDAARAFLSGTAHATNLRRRTDARAVGTNVYELRDAGGVLVFGSASWPEAEAAVHPASATDPYWRYDRSNARWHLRILEPRRSVPAFLRYNARFILPYLLVAFPFVLLAVWLTVRASLNPLQQLAQRIDQRASDDLRAIGAPTPYRELKPLVNALDTLLARLRATVERERAFVQDAAHEMRTPLAVISAQAHVLTRSGDATVRDEARAQLDHAIARAAHLSKQLLALAALDDSELRPTRQLDLANWLRETMARHQPLARGRHIELALEAPDALQREVDLPALDSVVQNLLENAIRYGHDGGQVLVSLQPLPPADAGWQLTVQDDGPGMPPAEQGHAFERFFRGSAAQAAGTGLGLSIVRQAAQRMGGQASLVAGLNGHGFGVLVQTHGPSDPSPPCAS